MRIRFEHNHKSFEYERQPMSPERFEAVCKLVGLAVGGIVLLGAIALAGFWAIPWAVDALALVLFFKSTLF